MMAMVSLIRFLQNRLNLSQFAIEHSRLTISFWIAIAISGLLAFSSLKYALFPDIIFPMVVVNGSAPTETALATETQLTQPLEAKLLSLEGLIYNHSWTYPGKNAIYLEFDVGTDLAAITTTVETTLAQINLPPETTFEVTPLNLNESAAISYAIRSDRQDLKTLTQRAKTEILPKIAILPGVLRVDLLGTGNLADTSPTLVRFQAEDALAFEVIKQANANTLEVVSQVDQAVQQLRTTLPDVQLTLATTQADYIQEATQSTIEALILAIALAILVIFLFLRNGRATLITAITIPISLLGTCIVMAIYNFNLETITLLALALVIGIVVDDAIVEVENIIRHIEEGESPRQAALSATREIGLTVSASTLTIVAVFLPVAFMGGTIGQFFKPFGLTISAAVLISLLAARTLTPVLAMYWLKTPSRQTNPTQPEVSLNSSIVQSYSQLLSHSLQHPKITLLFAICSLIAGIALIPLIPQGFIPKLDRGEFNIVYTTTFPQASNSTRNPEIEEKPTPQLEEATPPTDAPISTSQAVATLQQGGFNWLSDLLQNPTKLLLRKTRNIGTKIEEIVRTVPDVESVFTIAGIRGQPNLGKIKVTLKDDRQLTTAQVQEKIRQNLPEFKTVSISIEDIQFVDTGGEKPLQVALVGADINALNRTAKAIKLKLENKSEFVDVTVTGDQNTEDEILEIEHLNGKRAVLITANLSPGQALGSATQEVVKMAQDILPPNITLDYGGDSALIGKVFSSFGRTLALSVICMISVLILPFGRLLEPIVVALSLPLSIVGAMLGLLVTQSDFGMISLMGLIFLLGLLDKNALLLMDYINQLRQAGMNRTAAILRTGKVRLRPILMTTASTILGMMPIAFGLGAGAELRQPMAVAIIGGLLTSTLLSLIVVPVLYTVLEDRKILRDFLYLSRK